MVQTISFLETLEMIETYGNITEIQTGVIVHGVNCSHAMGSGVALAIKRKWPKVYESYIRACQNKDVITFYGQKNLLGTIDVVYINDDLYVINAFTQLNYGREAGRRYVSYDAVDDCFKTIARLQKEPNCKWKDLNLFFPKIGSGLGGGDWKIIKSIIQHHEPENKAYVCLELKPQTE